MHLWEKGTEVNFGKLKAYCPDMNEFLLGGGGGGVESTKTSFQRPNAKS